MIINLQKMVEFVDSTIDSDDDRTTVHIIIPIMHHARNTDKIVISGNDNFEVILANEKMHFKSKYNNRVYDIFDDFYSYDNDTNDLRDMNYYMDHFIRESYENEGSWIAIYYCIED